MIKYQIEDAVAAVRAEMLSIVPDQVQYVDEHQQRIYRDIRWVLDNLPKEARILDIGSFPWFVPGVLSRLGYENIQSIDIDRTDLFQPPSQWKICSVQLDVEEEPLPFKDESFDVCLMYEVFEHLYKNPNFTMGEVRRTLKVDGMLAITTPNGGRLNSWIDAIRRKRL